MQVIKKYNFKSLKIYNMYKLYKSAFAKIKEKINNL